MTYWQKWKWRENIRKNKWWDIAKESDVLLQVLCSSEVRTRSLHRPTHKMSLQPQGAEQVKTGTQCTKNQHVCTKVWLVTCICVAPLALHSIAICCWRNSSWQEVTCNAVTMATCKRDSEDVLMSRKEISNMRLCDCFSYCAVSSGQVQLCQVGDAVSVNWYKYTNVILLIFFSYRHQRLSQISSY